MLIIKKHLKEIFFLFLIILIFYKSPYIFLYGRFMAEEGSIFFSKAYSGNFVTSIFYIDFNSGYYNLWANTSAVIASWFKLEVSPLVTVYLSLIPKLFIFYFILYGNSFLFNNLKNKYIGCLIFLVSPAIVPEVWANTINSQLFFCLLMLIYCFEDFKKKISITIIVSVFFAGMSGLYSVILTPIFFYKYKNFKNRQDKYNYYTILFCLITQLTIVLYAKFNNLIYKGKIHFIDLELAINFTYNVIFKSIFGLQSKIIISFFNFDSIYYLLVTLLFFIFISYYLFKKFKTYLKKNIYVTISLFYSFSAISLFVMIGSVSNYVGGRYAVVPSILFLLIFMNIYNLLNASKVKYFFLTAIIASICFGLYEYKTNNRYYKFLECVSCPDWPTEVRNWREQPNYLLKIWPYTINKTMSLKD